MRQEWRYKVKRSLKKAKISELLPVLMICILAFAGSNSAIAATSRYFWSDPSTGFAIGGFDPLTYFTTRRPQKGIAKNEYEWHGVTFRFANQGNMAAFRDHPEIYAPQYGGYDAYAMADGKLVEGNPKIWMKKNNRIFLFASRRFRALWLVRRDSKVKQAIKFWSEISKDLVE